MRVSSGAAGAAVFFCANAAVEMKKTVIMISESFVNMRREYTSMPELLAADFADTQTMEQWWLAVVFVIAESTNLWMTVN